LSCKLLLKKRKLFGILGSNCAHFSQADDFISAILFERCFVISSCNPIAIAATLPNHQVSKNPTMPHLAIQPEPAIGLAPVILSLVGFHQIADLVTEELANPPFAF
jgi:hypothetical protein